MCWSSQVSLDFSKESESVYNFVVSSFATHLQHLKYIILPQTKISSKSLARISSLQKLERLSFQWNENFSKTNLSFLSSFSTLKHLSITSGSQFGSTSMKFLENFPKLEYLKIEIFQRKVIIRDSPFLLGLTELRVLDLSWCKHISPTALMEFKNFPKLEVLIFDMCFDFSDECLKCISIFENIKSLSLRWCHCITDNGIAHLAKMPSLVSLNLSNCPHVTPKGISVLSEHCTVILPSHQQ